jgi:phosphoglucosamine mutase
MAAVAQGKLFGTDGVRGKVGELLTPELAFTLGRAAVSLVERSNPQVLVVRDTRESGDMLESALCAGIAAGGGQALLAGILPTPAAAVLVRRLGLDLSAVISASHNPYYDNGIKFFDSNGRKISDEGESAIEERIGVSSPAVGNGRIRGLTGAVDDYLRELGSHFQLELNGQRVLLDCANGATYRVAPTMFDRLGAQVDSFANEPDGRNINAGCGSTHVNVLSERVREGQYDIGFAFDGDGDRVLAVDRDGRVVDGDEIIAHAALHLKAQGALAGNGVAVTVMTNYGFHQAMSDADIEVATTKVGDRHVVDELFKRDWTMGGEQSGHIINMGFTPSGDGIAAALLLLEALDGRDLAETQVMEKLPQCLVNVPVPDRQAFERSSAVREAVDRESAQLEGRGRVLVRPSGTEPVVRVMAEAPERDECEAVASRLKRAIEAELGAPEGQGTAGAGSAQPR